MEINSYKELIVWQKSMELAREVYRATVAFPRSELYGLSAQMRRAAIAIPSNIAEGFSRKHRREYRQFLLIAFGSGAELETQTRPAEDFDYLKGVNLNTINNLLDEVQRMLNKMIQSLNVTPPPSTSG